MPTHTVPTRPALRPLDEALAQLLSYAQPLNGIDLVSTFDADGRVLGQDVVAALQVPPLDNSAMDGYALRCADVKAVGSVLPVLQRIPAGSPALPLAADSVARIFTGAPVPLGADTVMMQEDCEPLPGEPPRVRLLAQPRQGQWIRRAGEDIQRGATVLLQGQRLSPACLGLAASIGLANIPVARRPRVALLSTGDELVMPGEVQPELMLPGSIYNSNRFFLRALLARIGCAVTDLGIVSDNRQATVNALQSAAQQHDLILTSGGVSVGEEDHIKPAVQTLGELALWQIAMKPGKPFAYGRINNQTSACHFIGLPGNPVSSFVTFVLLVRPFVLRLQGASQVAMQSVAARADFDWPAADKRREFLRVRRNPQGGLDLFANQSSGVLTSAVWADGLVDNPAGQAIAHGDAVRFVSWESLTA
jgi:molybdopterin molybdotransferase